MTIAIREARRLDQIDGIGDEFENALPVSTRTVYGDRAGMLGPGDPIMFEHEGRFMVATVEHVRVGMYYGEQGELRDSGDWFYAAFVTVRTGEMTGETIIFPHDAEVMVLC